MKEMKKLKKKAIPHCYQRTLSRSNTSLSQLLHIASYKKRINDLSRNNRLLALALQESRIEGALQSNLIKDYAKDSNQILFARLKLNEMAKNIAKFVTDLEEVRHYLNIDFPTKGNPFPQKNGSPSDRIFKVPTVDCIEEVSVLSSDNDAIAKENLPEIFKTSDLILSDVKPDDKDPCDDIQPSTLECNTACTNDIEMAPILFIEDSEEKKKTSSKSRHSKVSSGVDKGSLTPELDIDLTCIKRKRTSSRRMTQFQFPETSRSKSKGKTTSRGKKSSPEESITPVKSVSPPLLHLEQDLPEANKIQEIAEHSFIENMKESENLNGSSHNVLSVVDHVNHVNHNNPPDATSTCLPINAQTAAPLSSQRIETNHTLLLCEDMELTEVLPQVHQIIMGNTLSAEGKTSDSSEIKSNIPDGNKKDETNEEISSEKQSPPLSDYHQTIVVNNDDIQLPVVVEADYDEEIQNVGMLTFCEPNEVEHENTKNKDLSLKDMFSPTHRPSRPKKSVKYAVFFSSDESDRESPVKPLQERKKSSKSKQTTKSKKEVHEIIPSSVVTPDCLRVQKISSEDENKVSKHDLSVYNLDVSNSEKSGKKKLTQKSKKSGSRKANSNKELPKPLFQQCSVTKLKAGNYKFFKNETFSKKLEMFNERLKNSSINPISLSNSPGGILKKMPSDMPQDSVENLVETALKECANNEAEYHISSPVVCQSTLETPKSESKRVSFAPTDLVCNFRRMSVSKKIADNKKVRRTSKSVRDFKELFEKEAHTKTMSHLDTDISSESTAVEKEDRREMLNFSDDTELYTFTFPSNTSFITVPPADLLLPSNTTTSDVDAIKNINGINDQTSLKVKINKKSPKASGKLSLKKKKNSEKALLPHIPDKAVKETNILLSESPKSVITTAKRKSLFKELSEDDLKENVNSDHPSPEITEDVLKIRMHTSKKSLVLSENKKKSLTDDKCQNKANSKTSLKRNNLSGKHKHLQQNRESSPVLKDVLNVTSTESKDLPRRRSKQISYKEPTLNKKLRRE